MTPRHGSTSNLISRAVWRSALVMSLALSLLAVSMIPAASSPRGRAVPVRLAGEVRSTDAGEFGLFHPRALTYLAGQDALLVMGFRHSEGLTGTVEITPAGRRMRDVRVPGAVGAVGLAFDPVARRLGVLTPRALSTISRNRAGFADARSKRLALAGVGVGRPLSIAYDQPGRSWYVLGTEGLIRVRARGPLGERMVRVGLPGMSDVRGVASNPADGLLYLIDSRGTRLFAMDRSGRIRAVYMTDSVGLQRPRAITFAPSADRTDGPGTLSLYVADRGAPGSAGRIVEVSLTVTATASTVAATLVRTIDTSRLSPPSPDPAGVTYLPSADRLVFSDSEVDEMPIFQNVNLYTVTRTGTLSVTGVTTAFTHEPTGVAYNPSNGHLFISDDDQLRVFEDVAGPDGRYGTSDDVVTSISSGAYGSGDTEDVTFDARTGDLFTVDGVNKEVYRVSPGLNGRFDGLPPTGDDTSSHFDVGVFGAQDPEAIVYDQNRDTLVVADHTSKKAYEVSTSGALINTIDISAAPGPYPAGITLAPGSANPAQTNMYIVDRGVDNNSDPNENDGRLYEMSVSLPPLGNQPPLVNAGADQSIVLPASATLNGTVTDDGLPNPPASTTHTWSAVSGPGSVTFADPAALSTTASFTVPGTYVLRLSASDSALSASDDVTVTVIGPNGPFSLDRAVATSSDDAEESSSGSMSLTSSDLELVHDSTDQTVGLRFTNITIPRGASIQSAYLQFEVDEVSTDAASLTIRGHAADNPGTFTTASLNISSRPRTAASVAWVPPSWPTIQVHGPDQRTPNLAPIVQEIVNRPGWAGGNAVVVIVNGTGRRTAEAFDGTFATTLHVEYTTGGAPPNLAPTVDAGPDQSVVLPSSASLSGSVSDDGLPNPPGVTTHQWSKVGGPGTVSFGDATALSTTATFSAAGTYVLRLTASDSELTASDDMTVTALSAGGPFTLERAVAVSSDDAEERPSGGVNLNSSDLELVTDGTKVQKVGMRFTNVTVPAGATILNAYVQFQVDEVSTDATSLTIRGQAANNPGTFTTTSQNVSSRPSTVASVGWVPPSWPTVGARGPDQRTPSLVSIVQEIVNRSGWGSGNAMVVIVTGTGRRTAEARDGTFAPILHVEYSIG